MLSQVVVFRSTARLLCHTRCSEGVYLGLLPPDLPRPQVPNRCMGYTICQLWFDRDLSRPLYGPKKAYILELGGLGRQSPPRNSIEPLRSIHISWSFQYRVRRLDGYTSVYATLSSGAEAQEEDRRPCYVQCWIIVSVS